MNGPYIYAIIMLLAGLGIPVMAALNSSLGSKLQSPILAATILFTVAFLTALLVLSVTDGLPKNSPEKPIPWYLFFGGVLIIFYVLSITWIAPRFGITNAISFVLLGQLIAMTIIDHYGFVNMPQYSITRQRVLGLILMATGVLLVVNR